MRIDLIALPNATSAGSSACFGEGFGIDKSSRHAYDHTTDDLPHKDAMFRVDERFELGVPAILREEGVRRFWVVEQCFNHPLWQIHVLSPSRGDDGECQFRARLLVTRTSDALGVLLGEKWERAEVHLILPSYMTGRQGPLLTKCSAVWECADEHDERRATWLMETDLGDYVDAHYGVKLADAKKVALRWADQNAA